MMDEDINVPLLAGLLSALGTLLLGLLCIVLWFAIAGDGRIQLGSGEPGSFDDESALIEEEADALEIMDELSRTMYLQAKAFIEANPPNSENTDISLSQFMTIQEKGVSAWEFEVDFANANCFVEGRTEIEFFDSICCVQTNLPLPKQNEVYYWEAKIYDKPLTTTVSVGLTTKPYPTFRLPGYHRYSVAYDSEGLKRINQPFSAPHYGPPLQQGDVVGVGYKPRTGTVFFTRNGKKLEEALHGMRMNLFPTIGATGSATIMVNFGQAGFVYIEANVKKWGLAPAHGSLAPPPPYGAEQDYVLLETGIRGGSSHHNSRHQNNNSNSRRYKGGYNSSQSQGQQRLSPSQFSSISTTSEGSNEINDITEEESTADDINLLPPSFDDVTSEPGSYGGRGPIPSPGPGPGPSGQNTSTTSSGINNTSSLATSSAASPSTHTPAPPLPPSQPSSNSIGSIISTISEDQVPPRPTTGSPRPNPYSLNNGASINLTTLPQRARSISPSTTNVASTASLHGTSSNAPSITVSPIGPPQGRPPSYTSDNESDDEENDDGSSSSRQRRMSTRESILEATGEYITPDMTPQP